LENIRLIIEVIYGVTVIKFFSGLLQTNESMKALFDILLLPALSVLVSLMAYYLILSLSRPASFALSKALNSATWKRIIAMALGGDTRGEVCVSATPSPMLAARRFPSLPQELEDELSAFSDKAAGETIARLRRTVRELAISLGDQTTSTPPISYVTWDELIHTNYFDNIRLRKLIAYSVGQQAGFAHSDSFRCDPDFEKVAKWYAELLMHAKTLDR